jgi:spore maturation protein SpmA
MSRLSTLVLLIFGVLAFFLGLLTFLATSASFVDMESYLLENPLFGGILSLFWDFEFGGRTLQGEWYRSVPFVQAIAMITTSVGVLCVWVGVASFRSTDDWRRR